MIHKRGWNNPILQTTNEELQWLNKIISKSMKGVYYLHGLRNNRPLYKIIKSLQDKNLIGRKGYHYFPTKHGWLHIIHLRETKQLIITEQQTMT